MEQPIPVLRVVNEWSPNGSSAIAPVPLPHHQFQQTGGAVFRSPRRCDLGVWRHLQRLPVQRWDSALRRRSGILFLTRCSAPCETTGRRLNFACSESFITFVTARKCSCQISVSTITEAQ